MLFVLPIFFIVVPNDDPTPDTLLFASVTKLLPELDVFVSLTREPVFVFVVLVLPNFVVLNGLPVVLKWIT